jgi:hypothetical protein
VFKGVKTINTNVSVVFTATWFDPKGVSIIRLNTLLQQTFVLRSTEPDDDPSGPKHFAISTTNKVVSMLFTPLIKRKSVKDDLQKT